MNKEKENGLSNLNNEPIKTTTPFYLLCNLCVLAISHYTRYGSPVISGTDSFVSSGKHLPVY